MEINCRGSIPECDLVTAQPLKAISAALIILANMRRELRVPRAEAAGDALNEDFGVGTNKEGYVKFSIPNL